jgi:hypothetical protein
MRKLYILVLLVLLSGFATTARAQSGHTNWNGWSFDWEVKDGSGLAIRNVTYNGEYVIYKTSMPVIRVRYDNDDCGPYADRIYWESLVPISNCNDSKVCQQGYTAGGHNMLELGIYARIGSYHLYQAYYFSEDGWMGTYLWSKGLQCNTDHIHHPYWRMDFDINGYLNDQIFVFDNNRGNEGWGPGWHKYTTEQNDVKNPATGRVWFVRDNPTGHGAWILPGSNDGTADGFSSIDMGGRIYHYNEDEPWPFGAGGELGYSNGESVEEKDIVFWYVAHLHHAAAQGGDQWHSAGPWVKVQR